MDYHIFLALHYVCKHGLLGDATMGQNGSILGALNNEGILDFPSHKPRPKGESQAN
jgi:hypothetical protein